jgi:hypothetical protein
MKRLTFSLITAALLSCMVPPVFAGDETENPPNASFGIAGSYSEYNAWERKKGESHMRYEFAPGYGGGLVFEKMFNNLLGIHSGLWFNRFSIDMRMKQSGDWTSIDPSRFITMKMMATGWSISFPLSLIMSFDASFFSLNILAGIKYMQIVDSQIKLDNYLLTYKRHFDMLPYLQQPQFGFTAGITFKFRVSRFVDLFVGGEGTLYVTELVKENDNIFLLFDLTTLAGVLFRTNIFPMRTK